MNILWSWNRLRIRKIHRRISNCNILETFFILCKIIKLKKSVWYSCHKTTLFRYFSSRTSRLEPIIFSTTYHNALNFLHNTYFKVTTSVRKKKGHQFLSRIINLVTHTWLRVMTNITTLCEPWYVYKVNVAALPPQEKFF